MCRAIRLLCGCLIIQHDHYPTGIRPYPTGIGAARTSQPCRKDFSHYLPQPPPVVSLARLREQPETAADMAANVNEEFAFDSSDKGLLEIPDMSSLAELDMHVSDGHFDPERFAPVRNAIVLSKLLLLGAPELNRLVSDAGVSSTIYGASLFGASDSFNILFDAVRSIDGNHQWQEVALPYPRKSGIDPGWWAERQYGYPFSGPFAGRKGFRLWQDCEVRREIFHRIFLGPIAPSLSPQASTFVAGWESDSNRFPQSARSVDPLKTRTDGSIVCGTSRVLLPRFVVDADILPPALEPRGNGTRAPASDRARRHELDFASTSGDADRKPHQPLQLAQTSMLGKPRAGRTSQGRRRAGPPVGEANASPAEARWARDRGELRT